MNEKAKILVVDDEKIIRDGCYRVLSGKGYEVITAENGQAALDTLAKEPLDIILLDLVMPVMDGTTFLKRRQEEKRYRGIPVIVCTGKELTREEYDRLKTQAVAVLVEIHLDLLYHNKSRARYLRPTLRRTHLSCLTINAIMRISLEKVKCYP